MAGSFCSYVQMETAARSLSGSTIGDHHCTTAVREGEFEVGGNSLGPGQSAALTCHADWGHRSSMRAGGSGINSIHVIAVQIVSGSRLTAKLTAKATMNRKSLRITAM